MAVTGAIFKSLTFNGESSRNYGIYITGEGVYNAPKRDVEMITIPGKNGSFPLDHGRFENIEVTYPAGVYADNEEDFADAISDFRNMLCSAKGYCRLEDEYNPDEYRMAIYKSGLEVEPALLKAGEFEITFECKPQRYLKSGETAVTIGASTTLTNPTRFESSPELKVKGYGTIEFNGYDIDIKDAIYGDVILVENKYLKNYIAPLHSEQYANNGDIITLITSPELTLRIKGDQYALLDATMTSATSDGEPYFRSANSFITAGFNNSTYTFTKGSNSGELATIDATMTVMNIATTTTFTATLRIQFDIDYQSAPDQFEFFTTITTTPNNLLDIYRLRYGINKISVYGTKSVLGNPTIIDCENGEVYKETSDGIVSLNAYIDLGAELPKLASGSNTVTTANTITECKLSPRWWKV